SSDVCSSDLSCGVTGGGSPWSCSSCNSPTSSSARSSMVRMPANPPYSSTTHANSLCVVVNSRYASGSTIVVGSNSGLRTASDTGAGSSDCRASTSVKCTTPTTSSASSTTG